MEKLDKVRRRHKNGSDYWMAREVAPILGYPIWANFMPVIERAQKAFVNTGLNPSHHFVQTGKLMEVGKGGMREGDDYFLSRAAAYLIAMNGEPSKTEIAAAQAYFAIQTRRMELEDKKSDDEKRLELRGKVARSFKNVSGVAKAAGVRNTMQALFHDARYVGLYGMRSAEVKRKKGLTEKDNLFDFAGPLELSANDFQMNLAVDVLTRENVTGEQKAIRVNEGVAKRVRSAMRDSGSTMPENLPLEEPIGVVKKRIGAAAKKKLPPNS
jgi:DNA-damage-inducible protein D